jgi:hypothetical protein
VGSPVTLNASRAPVWGSGRRPSSGLRKRVFREYHEPKKMPKLSPSRAQAVDDLAPKAELPLKRFWALVLEG